MPNDIYTVKITLKNVAIGDVEDLAQRIYEEHGAELDASLGDFDVAISKGGFPVDWEPLS